MEIIDLSCPKCGGTMQPDAQCVNAVCEYCGHRVLFSEPQRQALVNRRTQQNRPLSKTEQYQKKIEQEKKDAPQNTQQSADDEGLGRVLWRIFGLRFRLRQFISLIVLFLSGVVAFVLADRLYTAEWQTYYLVAGVVTTVVGAFCVWVSYRVYRSVPLGAGLGILLSLLVQALR